MGDPHFRRNLIAIAVFHLLLIAVVFYFARREIKQPVGDVVWLDPGSFSPPAETDPGDPPPVETPQSTPEPTPESTPEPVPEATPPPTPPPTPEPTPEQDTI
ncbi:MAG: hypothetical protein WCQ57_15845, partial [Verrucomicrobiota bacterium]